MGTRHCTRRPHPHLTFFCSACSSDCVAASGGRDTCFCGTVLAAGEADTVGFKVAAVTPGSASGRHERNIEDLGHGALEQMGAGWQGVGAVSQWGVGCGHHHGHRMPWAHPTNMDLPNQHFCQRGQANLASMSRPGSPRAWTCWPLSFTGPGTGTALCLGKARKPQGTCLLDQRTGASACVQNI